MLLNILLVLLTIVAVALTGLVLLQRSEGGALGMGGGGGQLISARGAANFLTKTTWILAFLFFGLSLGITIITGRQAASGSVVDRMKIQGIDTDKFKQPAAPAAPPSSAPPPALPDVPLAPAGGTLGNFGAPAPTISSGPVTVLPAAKTPAPKAAAPKAAAQPKAAAPAQPKTAATAPVSAPPPPISLPQITPPATPPAQ